MVLQSPVNYKAIMLNPASAPEPRKPQQQTSNLKEPYALLKTSKTLKNPSNLHNPYTPKTNKSPITRTQRNPKPSTPIL